MDTIRSETGNWYIELQKEDGARISVLKYRDYDLLTPAPALFKAPERDYGQYENRPVYGYDDCFPTVEECRYPGENFHIKDHGDVCWQDWHITSDNNRLICETDLQKPGLKLVRMIEFQDNILTWHFEVINRSGKKLPFMHVMHPLMPVGEIASVELSGFAEVYSETNSVVYPFEDSKEVNNYLQNLPKNSFEMLFIRNIKKGIARLGLRNGMQIKIEYDRNLFPTTGIWWNNGGYPDENGIRRSEFAIEPIPGTCSNLEKSFSDGHFQEAEPGKKVSWIIKWTME